MSQTASFLLHNLFHFIEWFYSVAVESYWLWLTVKVSTNLKTYIVTTVWIQMESDKKVIYTNHLSYSLNNKEKNNYVWEAVFISVHNYRSHI